MLQRKERIGGFYVYEYTFLDDLSYIKNPYDCFELENREEIDDRIHRVKEVFLECGWEGDGDIGIMWLPPFLNVGLEDGVGIYIWHVKQSNNGISFLACDHPLDFERLKKQNK